MGAGWPTVAVPGNAYLVQEVLMSRPSFVRRDPRRLDLVGIALKHVTFRYVGARMNGARRPRAGRLFTPALDPLFAPHPPNGKNMAQATVLFPQV